MTLKDELPRSVGTQYAAGEECRNSSRKNEEAEPKQKQCPPMNGTGDGSKVRCGKEQYSIETWNVRSMNQGKLEVVKQDTTRVNIDILRISELKRTRMGKFKSDNHYIHTVKGFGIVHKAEIDVFLELSCFFDDPVEVGNLISGSSAFSKTSLNIWKFTVHILLKPGLENFEHYFTSMWDECNCAVV